MNARVCAGELVFLFFRRPGFGPSAPSRVGRNSGFAISDQLGKTMTREALSGTPHPTLCPRLLRNRGGCAGACRGTIGAWREDIAQDERRIRDVLRCPYHRFVGKSEFFVGGEDGHMLRNSGALAEDLTRGADCPGWTLPHRRSGPAEVRGARGLLGSLAGLRRGAEIHIQRRSQGQKWGPGLRST